jgi:hypothetical protein
METPASAPVDATVADEPATATGPVWRFLISWRWLGWHLFVVVAFWGMLWLGDWQFHRAMTGNGLSWAYTFEWPLFAGFGVVFWARTIRDEFRLRRGPTEAETEAAAVEAASSAASMAGLPAGLGSRRIEPPDDGADDTELASYNAYLEKLSTEVKGHGRWRGFG